jgi:hypothetical protein
MAQNSKTRIVFSDYNDGTSPYGVFVQTEFDIYQEAIDYVETTIRNFNLLGQRSIVFYVYNYNNPSYSFRLLSNGSVTKTEIVFPDLLP